MYRASVLILVVLSAVFADRGEMSITRPDVSVYGPGQKAIIAWNGKTEVIVLSTDIYAGAETKVLGVLPLPALPQVTKGDFKSFEVVQQLIHSHLPRPKVLTKDGGIRQLVPTSGVEVLFHEWIGAHDITAVKANDYQEFVRWAKEFVKKSDAGAQGAGAQGASASNAGTVEFSQAWQEVIKQYLDNNYRYFVFDLVTVGSEKRSIEPIVYKFASRFLYYPLVISSLMPGSSEIQLFTISPEIPDIWSVEPPFEFGSYFTYHGQKKNIIFKIGIDEVNRIAPQFGKLFSQPPFFACLKYDGPLSDLDRDLVFSQFFKPVKH